MAYINGKEILFSVDFVGDSDAEAARQEGYAEGYANGKQAEYDAFWDIYQENGKRTSYANAFSGTGWTDATLNPKYPLRVKNANNMFTASKVTDYVVIAERIGGMDFTDCTSYSYAWQSAAITRIGDLDFSKCTSSSALQATFYLCKSLVSVGTVKVSEANSFPRTFESCIALEDITFDGTIAKDISFANSSLLSLESMWNIVDHLADFSATDPGTEMGQYAHTITFSNEAWQRLMQDSATPWGILDQNKWNLVVV